MDNTDEGRKIVISIHTTTQVVTTRQCLNCMCAYDFNPHHHAGGDRGDILYVRETWDFNPHHHAGGDPINTLATATLFQFQSTPPRRW